MRSVVRLVYAVHRKRFPLVISERLYSGFSNLIRGRVAAICVASTHNLGCRTLYGNSHRLDRPCSLVLALIWLVFELVVTSDDESVSRLLKKSKGDVVASFSS